MAGPSRPSKQSQDSPVPDAIPDDPLLNWDPDKILVEDNPYLGGYGDIGGLRASYQPSPGQIRFGSGRVLSSVGGGGPGGRGGGGGGSRSGVVPGLEHRLSQLLNDINTSSKNISHTHSFDDKNSINSKRSAQLTREQHLQEAQRVEDELKDIEARNREALRLIKYKTRLENEQRRRKHSRVGQKIFCHFTSCLTAGYVPVLFWRLLNANLFKTYLI